MAAKLTLLKDFEGGQGGGASNYVTYAADFDTNLRDIENTVNQLVDESTAILASNALLPQDLLQANDAARAGGTLLEGVVGGHSYFVSINGGDATLLDIEIGSAFVNNRRVAITSLLQASGTGLGGSPVTAFLALDVNGLPTLSVIPATMRWTSSASPGTARSSLLSR